jgi:hypothetical protein
MQAILISALIVAIGVPAVALGAGEGRSLIAGKRNPQGGSLARETQIISRNGTYSTRQSNLGAGGGAIYGCRAEAGNAEPCVRANNLTTGRAFEFETGGKEGGEILVKDTTGVPFVTNATGKVANLNADKLDDKSAEDFADKSELLFAAVADGGTLGANRGATASTRNDANTTTVTFNRDVSKCSFTATASNVVGTPAAPEALAASVAGTTGTAATQVVIREPGTATDHSAFHLQVIC